jgi:hypothetical protein
LKSAPPLRAANDIYTVRQAEAGDLLVLELQGLILRQRDPRCGDIPDALAQRLIELAPSRHSFAV